MKYTNTVTPYENITMGENPRIPTNLALDSLKENIEAIGLLEPITLWEPEKGKLEVVRGHRRTMAIGLIKSTNPKRFAELFGKGIPSLRLSDVTSDEVIDLKLDHSEQRGLSDPHELQRSANMLFSRNKVESDVANQLAGLIDKIAPMKTKNRVELEALRLKIQAAKATGNEAAIKLAEKEVKEYIFNYRRGFVQNLHNTYRCPERVMQALFKKATGQKPEGCDIYLPSLTAADVTTLWKAHKADLEILEGGIPKYNRQRVGPHFTEKWDNLVAKEKAAIEAGGDEKEVRAKAMSAKDMNAELTEGKYKSELAVKLTHHHMGKNGESLVELDNASYYSDLVRKHDKALYEKIEQAAKVIEKRLIAADEAAKAKETEQVKVS